MMRFDFSISHIPGKDLVIADTLLRAPIGQPTKGDQLLQQETRAFVSAVIQNLPASEKRLGEIKEHQETMNASR